jgi:hypothetical protein
MKILTMVFCVTLVVCVAGCSVRTVAELAPRSEEEVAIKGMKVTVSSTQQNYKDEGSPEALVDGDRGTRWASQYKDKQEVVVDMGKEVKLSGVRLLWEAAAPKIYSVSLSKDGKTWESAHKDSGGKTGPRTDEVNLKDKKARFIRLELTERATEWGFSLYEIEPILSRP